MHAKDYPVLISYPNGKKQLRAWCPYCKIWHLQGFSEKIRSKTVGHWEAECKSPKSPLHKTGYRLKIMTKAEIRTIADSLEFYD